MNSKIYISIKQRVINTMNQTEIDDRIDQIDDQLGSVTKMLEQLEDQYSKVEKHQTDLLAQRERLSYVQCAFNT